MLYFVRIFFIIWVLCQFSPLLRAALPELSSIEPIEFDENAQRLIARGDARIDFGDIRLSADRINYYKQYGLAEASGNVAIMTDNYRLIADRLNYETEDSIFSINDIRTGQWPIYISSDNAGGTSDHIILKDTTVYYGEPHFLTPSITASKMDYFNEENGILELGPTTFRIGKVPLLVLPGYTHHIKDGSPFFIDTDFGTRSELGTFYQTTTLFSVCSWLRLGANLDGYTKRGVLAGPTAQYVYDTPTQTIKGALSTGYLDDQDDSPNDINNEPIDSDRGFIEWRHQHRIGERTNITAVASYWSDSEVTRDFRQDYFTRNQQPDTFVEGVYAGDNYFLSAFGRFRPNEFQLIQERLPEIRFDLLPVPIFATRAYQRLSTSYTNLREDFDSIVPGIAGESQSDRIDLTYRIERPMALADWLTLTPIAGARITHYENQQFDPLVFSAFGIAPGNNVNLDGSATRGIYELGFDLEARAYATYSTINRTWDVNGLRHLLRPVLRYRYFSDPGSEGEIAPIDRAAFNLNRPLLSLSDLRNVDTISETHLARLGVENLFQTRANEYGSRTLAALNFYQDILFERNARYDGDQEDAFHATWAELVLNPAPWLKFDIASRFRTENVALEELRTRTLIRSGEIWEIGLSTDFLQDRIDQFRVDFMCRVNRRISLMADARYDLETDQFTRTEFALVTKLNATWTIIYAVIFRQDAVREDDVQFSVSLNLTDL